MNDRRQPWGPQGRQGYFTAEDEQAATLSQKTKISSSSLQSKRSFTHTYSASHHVPQRVTRLRKRRSAGSSGVTYSPQRTSQRLSTRALGTGYPRYRARNARTHAGACCNDPSRIADPRRSRVPCYSQRAGRRLRISPIHTVGARLTSSRSSSRDVCKRARVAPSCRGKHRSGQLQRAKGPHAATPAPLAPSLRR